MIKVLEYNERTRKIKEISLNPDHIVSVRWSELRMSEQEKVGLSMMEMNHQNINIIEIVFSNGKKMLGVGHPDLIAEKIRTSKKLLLG